MMEVDLVGPIHNVGLRVVKIGDSLDSMSISKAFHFQLFPTGQDQDGGGGIVKTFL